MNHFLIVSFIFLMGLTDCKTVDKKQKFANVPLGCWKHSHEDDVNNASEKITYRVCAYDFPPSRGRGGFMLEADGKIALFGPSPIDAIDTVWGTWTQIGNNELKIAFQKTSLSRLQWKLLKKEIMEVTMN